MTHPRRVHTQTIMGEHLMSVGRPTKYSEEMAISFLGLIAEGYSVVQACDREDMPCKATIFKWLAEIKGFSDKYYHAKELSGDSDADLVQDLSYKAMAGEVDHNAARVAMTGFMWSAARKKPRKYGDRQHIEHSGHVDYSNLSDDELDRKLQELQQQVERSETE